MQYEIVDGDGRIVASENHTMRYFDEDELRAALESAGFALVRIAGWPDVDASPSLEAYPACLIARAK